MYFIGFSLLGGSKNPEYHISLFLCLKLSHFVIESARDNKQQLEQLVVSKFDGTKIEEQTEPFELPNSWCWEHLGNITNIQNHLRKPIKQSDRDKRSGEYPYYGAFGIIDDIDDYLFDGKYLFLAEDGKNLESRERPISIIADGKFWVNNHAHVLSEKKGVLLEYIDIFLNSPKVLIDQFLTGQDQVKLNKSSMILISISIPPISEQSEILQRVKSYLNFSHQIELRVYEAKARVDKLTQSILAKAFRGELTADWRAEHPELISGENSAEALLAKIQAAKTALDGKKKRTKAS